MPSERAWKTGHVILRDHKLILQGLARFHPDSVSNCKLLIKLHMCWLISRSGYKAADTELEAFPSNLGERVAYQTLYDSERTWRGESKSGLLYWASKMVNRRGHKRGLGTCHKVRNQGHISLRWWNFNIRGQWQLANICSRSWVPGIPPQGLAGLRRKLVMYASIPSLLHWPGVEITRAKP